METDKDYVKSPAFQIYPADFLADKNTLVMTAAEVGGYWLLLCVCWRENGLPDDIDELADLARTPVKQFQVSWEKRIKRCFIQRPDGRWTHNRLEKERVKQVENREKRAQAGAKGAENRWQTDSNAKNGDGKRIAKNSLSSSSSSSTTTTSSEKKDSVANATGASAAEDFTIWKLAVGKLAGSGMDQQAARSFIGGQCKTYGKESVSAAISKMMAQEPADPKSYLVAVLQGQNGNGRGVSKVDRSMDAVKSVLAEIEHG
jgi:uncharacterized protein YdaU (DUF1376 family)